MKDKYYVIRNSDGDVSITEKSKVQLLEDIDEYTKFIDEEMFVTRGDTNYWDDAIMIIKGKIVVPTPKTIVETYEVE